MQTYNFIKDIIIHEKEIKQQCCFLANDIMEYYRNCEELMVLVIQKGAIRFADELFFNFNDQNRFDRHYIDVKSYEG